MSIGEIWRKAHGLNADRHSIQACVVRRANKLRRADTVSSSACLACPGNGPGQGKMPVAA